MTDFQRKSTRQALQNVEVFVEYRGLQRIWHGTSRAIAADLHANGAGFLCRWRLKSGSRVILTFKGASATVRKVQARVVYCIPESNGFRTGTVFEEQRFLRQRRSLELSAWPVLAALEPYAKVSRAAKYG